MIKIEIASKEFNKGDHRIIVLRNIESVIHEGEFFCVYGPNACGKTTFLKIITSLDNDFDGEISHNGNIDKIGFIFQNYKESLFPWMDNLDNISYFLLLKGLSRKERYKKVSLFLKKYGLEVDLKVYPYQQSGGQQQLVSILRAMVYTPQLLIMDEPFSSLDQRMRLKMCDIIQKYWEEFGTTILFVSHDLDESLLLAERITVMRKLNDVKKNSVLETFKVHFPRPREVKLIESLDFFKLKSQILALMRRDIENEQTI